MIRALWLLIKIGFLIGLVIWIAERPGMVTVEWLEYTVKIQVGFFLLLLLAFVILGILIFSLIKGALDFPQTIARYNAYRNRIKGLRALTLGLTAVAAGDGKIANYQAYRARQFLPKDEALPKLLEAQAARLKGDESKAAKLFGELLDHKEASFLGVRGLLQTSLETGDHKTALELGRKALETYPKQAWVLKIVYDLEIKLRNWKSADKTLIRAESAGVIHRDKARSDRVAMFIAQADEAHEDQQMAEYRKHLLRAYGVEKHFVPAIIRLGRLYLEQGNRRAAVAMIADSWRYQPHPDLALLWGDCMSPEKENEGLARIRWFERLLSHKPDSVEALLALTRVLIQEGLWGEARKHLEKTESIRPNVNLYKLWAKLEERATGNQAAVRGWLEKAADAPRERVWICSETGRIYDSWVPVSDQGLFNTIIWDFPQGRNVRENVLGWTSKANAAISPV